MSSYEIGYITGITVVIFIFGISAMFYKKRNVKPVYDERQTLARLKAYKNAFWVLMSYISIVCVVLGPLDIVFADITTIGFIGIALAGSVLAISCIFSDCYFGINQQPKRYIRLLTAIAIGNIMIFITNIKVGGSIIEGGILTYKSIHIIGAVMIIAIVTALMIKQRISEESDL